MARRIASKNEGLEESSNDNDGVLSVEGLSTKHFVIDTEDRVLTKTKLKSVKVDSEIDRLTTEGCTLDPGLPDSFKKELSLDDKNTETTTNKNGNFDSTDGQSNESINASSAKNDTESNLDIARRESLDVENGGKAANNFRRIFDVKKKRGIGRVLPVLCDDDQNIDVLEEGGKHVPKSIEERLHCESGASGGVICQEPSSPSHSKLDSSWPWPSTSDEKSQEDDGKKSALSLHKLLWCFGAKKNENRHNAHCHNAQTIGDFDIFLSSTSEIQRADAKAKSKTGNKGDDADTDDLVQRGCCYDCLFMCKGSEDLNDELLRRTYQYRGEIKKYEEKIKKLEEDQNSYLDSLAYDLTSLAVQQPQSSLSKVNINNSLHHQGTYNANNDQENSTSDLASLSTFSSRHRRRSQSNLTDGFQFHQTADF